MLPVTAASARSLGSGQGDRLAVDAVGVDAPPQLERGLTGAGDGDARAQAGPVAGGVGL
jgi:hypothetical protein